MVTCNYINGVLVTRLDYKSDDGYYIEISDSKNNNMVFNNDMYYFTIKDTIGLQLIQFPISFYKLIEFVCDCLDCIDYAENYVIYDIFCNNPFDRYSIAFNYTDDENIDICFYQYNIVYSRLVSKCRFTQDSVVRFMNAILCDYLDNNHRIVASNIMTSRGIIWN